MIVIRHIGDTAYDSYISETSVPLKSAIKPKKQTKFAGDPVTSVKTIPVGRIRPHPPKWTINAGDLDLLIPIVLSQARADVNLNQDLRGNLSAASPRESHQSEETLPTQPLGQFQAHRSEKTTTNSIAPSRTDTPSQREIFCETGTGTSSSEDVMHSDRDMSEEATHSTGSESINEETSMGTSYSRTTTHSQSEIFTDYNANSESSSRELQDHHHQSLAT